MKIQIDPDAYRVKENEKLKLGSRPTQAKNLPDEGKDGYEDDLEEFKKEIFNLQNILLAHDHYALLLIFQGMDTSGKDGAIAHVMSGVNPTGVEVTSFKKPTVNELDHDFLWRCNAKLPERGKIGIFNRSYYEEVLVVRVHPEILGGQKIPDEFRDSKKIWEHRFEDIRNYEKYLHRNGIITVKFFLHMSREEQKKRFLERIEQPDKNWKFSVFDVEERKFWNEYQSAYEEALSETSTDHAPWYVIPADKKKAARLIISQIILHHMKKLHVAYPELPPDQKKTLGEIRAALMNEDK